MSFLLLFLLFIHSIIRWKKTREKGGQDEGMRGRNVLVTRRRRLLSQSQTQKYVWKTQRVRDRQNRERERAVGEKC